MSHGFTIQRKALGSSLVTKKNKPLRKKEKEGDAAMLDVEICDTQN